MKLFDLILILYPPGYRAEFGDEMRDVFQSVISSRESNPRLICREVAGFLRGAAYERCTQMWRTAAVAAAGTITSIGLQLLMYWTLLPGHSKHVSRLASLVSRLFLLCFVVASVYAQPSPKQDPDTLDLAKSIYTRAFTELRAAKTMEDMKNLSDNLESPEWISIDRFGRTVLTRQNANQDLKSVLSLPPERRVTEMDIIWAERDSDRLMVLAWMMPNEVNEVDSAGVSHRLTRATLVRDLFQKTPAGWRRFQHDKLVPNSTVVSVDGAARILPPADEPHRVVPR